MLQSTLFENRRQHYANKPKGNECGKRSAAAQPESQKDAGNRQSFQLTNRTDAEVNRQNNLTYLILPRASPSSSIITTFTLFSGAHKELGNFKPYANQNKLKHM